MNFTTPLAATLSALSFAIGVAPASAAEKALEEVIVTAEFRRTSIMDTSASASVVGEDDIRQRAAQHLEEILNLAPNVNFAGGTSRARYFQIRGVGDRSQFQEPLNPSVGLRLDGVDFSGIGSIGTLFDVEQVEVLRGPQGTLHGANALAGLIDIRSLRHCYGTQRLFSCRIDRLEVPTRLRRDKLTANEQIVLLIDANMIGALGRRRVLPAAVKSQSVVLRIHVLEPIECSVDRKIIR